MMSDLEEELQAFSSAPMPLDQDQDHDHDILGPLPVFPRTMGQRNNMLEEISDIGSPSPISITTQQDLKNFGGAKKAISIASSQDSNQNALFGQKAKELPKVSFVPEKVTPKKYTTKRKMYTFDEDPNNQIKTTTIPISFQPLRSPQKSKKKPGRPPLQIQMHQLPEERLSSLGRIDQELASLTDKKKKQVESEHDTASNDFEVLDMCGKKDIIREPPASVPVVKPSAFIQTQAIVTPLNRKTPADYYRFDETGQPIRKSIPSTPIQKKNILEAHFQDQATLAEAVKNEEITQSQSSIEQGEIPSVNKSILSKNDARYDPSKIIEKITKTKSVKVKSVIKQLKKRSLLESTINLESSGKSSVLQINNEDQDEQSLLRQFQTVYSPQQPQNWENSTEFQLQIAQSQVPPSENSCVSKPKISAKMISNKIFKSQVGSPVQVSDIRLELSAETDTQPVIELSDTSGMLSAAKAVHSSPHLPQPPIQSPYSPQPPASTFSQPYQPDLFIPDASESPLRFLKMHLGFRSCPTSPSFYSKYFRQDQLFMRKTHLASCINYLSKIQILMFESILSKCPGNMLYNILTSSRERQNSFRSIISKEDFEDCIGNYQQENYVLYANEHFQIVLKNLIGLQEAIKIRNGKLQKYIEKYSTIPDFDEKLENLITSSKEMILQLVESSFVLNQTKN